MSLIITGSEGYIGTNLKKLLDSQGVPYIGFDRKINYDLLSPEGQAEFEHYASGAAVVIHLAAKPRIPESWTNTSEYVRDNIQLTEYVARVCAEKNCHLIFASSSSVYGNGQGPLNPYAWTKQASEEIIKLYGKNNLNYTICRIFTTFGNNGPLVLDKWLKQSLAGIPISIHGDGSQSRDFIHVEDVAAALYSSYLTRLNDEVLDIGTGRSHIISELADIFEKEVKFEQEVAGYARSTQAKAQRTMKLLNWAPKHPVIDWIRSSLDT